MWRPRVTQLFALLKIVLDKMLAQKYPRFRQKVTGTLTVNVNPGRLKTVAINAANLRVIPLNEWNTYECESRSRTFAANHRYIPLVHQQIAHQ
jgi:hypothetical protein